MTWLDIDLSKSVPYENVPHRAKLEKATGISINVGKCEPVMFDLLRRRVKREDMENLKESFGDYTLLYRNFDSLCRGLARTDMRNLEEFSLAPDTLTAHNGKLGVNLPTMRLSEALRRTNLKKAHLRKNGITAFGMQSLAKVFKKKDLTFLDLGANYIGSDGAEALAESLIGKRLTGLRLDGNRIGDAGAQALAPVLKKMERPGYCLLHDNFIDKDLENRLTAMAAEQDLPLREALYNSLKDDYPAIAKYEQAYEMTENISALDESALNTENFTALLKSALTFSKEDKILWPLKALAPKITPDLIEGTPPRMRNEFLRTIKTNFGREAESPSIRVVQAVEKVSKHKNPIFIGGKYAPGMANLFRKISGGDPDIGESSSSDVTDLVSSRAAYVLKQDPERIIRELSPDERRKALAIAEVAFSPQDANLIKVRTVVQSYEQDGRGNVTPVAERRVTPAPNNRPLQRVSPPTLYGRGGNQRI